MKSVIATDHKKAARLNLLRHVLHHAKRPDCKAERPDPAVVFPADAADFLNLAAERNLLRKVGGGYTFVHALLLDYFSHRS